MNTDTVYTGLPVVARSSCSGNTPIYNCWREMEALWGVHDRAWRVMLPTRILYNTVVLSLGFLFNYLDLLEFPVYFTYWILSCKVGGRQKEWGQMSISHRNVPTKVLYSSPLEERRQQTHWSVLHIPPRNRGEMGEVFLSMPQWGTGARATGGYMERKVDELTVIVKKERERKSIG